MLQVWTSEQYARAVVASGPYHVDGLAVATCAAEAQGQGDAPSVSAAGMQSADSSFNEYPVQLAAVGSVF